MTEKKTFRGPWSQKFSIVVLGVVLGVLFYWLLGFITRDIGTLKGPDYAPIRARHVDAGLVDEQRRLQEDIAVTKRNIRDQQEQQRILRDTTTSLQTTMNQLLSIQRLSIEKGVPFSDQSEQTLQESQAAFLENQQKYRAYNDEISALTRQQRQLEKQLADVSAKVQARETVARGEFNELMARHRMKIGVVKLAVLLPIFLAAAWFFMTKRTGPYWPIVYAAFVSAFIKVAQVSFAYFPHKYFKYVAIMVLIGMVLSILVWLIRRLIAPKKDWLMKQYQQAYDKWICPICSKPIRTGPLRWVAGARHKALIAGGQVAESAKLAPYTCPACGTALFDKCGACKDIRHTLLPYCEHCGTQKDD